MARLGRTFLPDQPLHVIQRGDNRGAVLPRSMFVPQQDDVSSNRHPAPAFSIAKLHYLQHRFGHAERLGAKGPGRVRFS
jgi:hypothetical protein